MLLFLSPIHCPIIYCVQQLRNGQETHFHYIEHIKINELSIYFNDREIWLIFTSFEFFRIFIIIIIISIIRCTFAKLNVRVAFSYGKMGISFFSKGAEQFQWHIKSVLLYNFHILLLLAVVVIIGFFLTRALRPTGTWNGTETLSYSNFHLFLFTSIIKKVAKWHNDKNCDVDKVR